MANGAVTLTVGNDNTNTTYNGQLNNGMGGTMALVKVGSGTLILGDDGGTNGFVNINPQNSGSSYLYALSTYSGGTTINGGTISILADTCLGATTSSSGVANTGSVTINGTALAPSTLQVTGTFSSARTFQLGPSSGAGFGTFDVTGNYTLTLTGAIGNQGGGSGGLVKVDSGTLVLTASGNSYTGGTIVTGGVLNFNADHALGNPTAGNDITFNGSAASGGGTLQFATIYSGTSLSSSRNITVAAGDSGTIDTNGNNITWGGLLTNSGAFNKVGAGSFVIDPLTLNSNSTINVVAGTLRLTVGSPSTIGTGVTATVASGATLELGGAVSALGNTAGISAGNLANVVNNSTAPGTGGLHVTGTANQLAGTITGSGNTVVDSAANLTAYQIRQNSLTINGTGTVALIPSGSGSTTNPAAPNNINDSSNVASLSIGGTMNAWTGTLDIGNNGLVIQYGAGSDPFTTITNMVKSGYANGNWTGAGITSKHRARPRFQVARLADSGVEHWVDRFHPQHRHLRLDDFVRGPDDRHQRRAGAADLHGRPGPLRRHGPSKRDQRCAILRGQLRFRHDLARGRHHARRRDRHERRSAVRRQLRRRPAVARWLDRQRGGPGHLECQWVGGRSGAIEHFAWGFGNSRNCRPRVPFSPLPVEGQGPGVRVRSQVRYGA